MRIRDSLVFRQFLFPNGSPKEPNGHVCDLCKILRIELEDLWVSELKDIQAEARERLREQIQETILFEQESKKAEDLIKETCTFRVRTFYRQVRRNQTYTNIETTRDLYRLLKKFGLITETFDDIGREVLELLACYHNESAR